jgi:dihydropyrimidinase
MIGFLFLYFLDLLPIRLFRQFKSDVLCVDGKIAAIGVDLSVPEGTEVIDATDRYVIPGLFLFHERFRFFRLFLFDIFSGGIDTHTHMQLPFMGTVSVDDFNIGTQAAVAGGTTFLSISSFYPHCIHC